MLGSKIKSDTAICFYVFVITWWEIGWLFITGSFVTQRPLRTFCNVRRPSNQIQPVLKMRSYTAAFKLIGDFILLTFTSSTIAQWIYTFWLGQSLFLNRLTLPHACNGTLDQTFFKDQLNFRKWFRSWRAVTIIRNFKGFLSSCCIIHWCESPWIFVYQIFCWEVTLLWLQHFLEYSKIQERFGHVRNWQILFSPLIYVNTALIQFNSKQLLYKEQAVVCRSIIFNKQ